MPVTGASPVAQTVKSLLAVQDTQVRSLSWGDPLEKETATHSSILTCKIPWMEEPGRVQSMGSKRVGHGCVTFTFRNKIVCMGKRKKGKEARMEESLRGKKKTGKEKEEGRESGKKIDFEIDKINSHY